MERANTVPVSSNRFLREPWGCSEHRHLQNISKTTRCFHRHIPGTPNKTPVGWTSEPLRIGQMSRGAWPGQNALVKLVLPSIPSLCGRDPHSFGELEHAFLIFNTKSLQGKSPPPPGGPFCCIQPRDIICSFNPYCLHHKFCLNTGCLATSHTFASCGNLIPWSLFNFCVCTSSLPNYPEGSFPISLMPSFKKYSVLFKR